MLRRLVKYADRVFGWSRSLDGLRDARKRPRIATGRVIKALGVMMLARLGGLNSAAIVRLGHGRWDIENHGFNERASQWHAGHLYRHDANALLVFWLLACLAYNLFQPFVSCNLKSALRPRHSTIYFAHMICSELHQLASP